MAISKEAVVVTVPADFTLSESCMELMNQLAVTIYKCATDLAHSCSTDVLHLPQCYQSFPSPVVFLSLYHRRAIPQKSSACPQISPAGAC